MRGFLTRHSPPFTRVLLVESGARAISEKVLSSFYDRHSAERIDLLTCFEGAPQPFRDGRILRTTDYSGRRTLLRELWAARYNVVAIVCSGEPYLFRYKCAIAALLPAKVLVINENGDYFWLDRGSLRILRKLLAVRTGLSGESAARTLALILAFPFTLAFLLLFAARVHLMRSLRLLLKPATR